MKKMVKILVIEDEKFWFKLLELEAKHHRVPLSLTWGANGEKAVEAIKQGVGYDLIVMNLEMPLMDGIKATKYIRSLGNKTPIIAWSAYSKEAKEGICLQAGMDAFIQKSGSPMLQELLALASQIVSPREVLTLR